MLHLEQGIVPLNQEHQKEHENLVFGKVQSGIRLTELFSVDHIQCLGYGIGLEKVGGGG